MATRPKSGRDKRVCVAQIGAAHGLKGEVRLQSFTEDPAAVAHYGPLESEDGSHSFEIESLRPAKDHFIAHFSGVNDRTAAEALRNLRLHVPRERLPKPAPGEFYHADLIGLAVSDTRGEMLGEVIAIHNFGAGDLLEIRLQDSSTVMLPFTDVVVPTIDLDAGRIIVNPPQEV
jgi:16S rRNA processing protein RimM